MGMVRCVAVQCNLRCGVITPFCGLFWLVLVESYCLSGMVNTLTLPIVINFFYGWITFFLFSTYLSNFILFICYLIFNS